MSVVLTSDEQNRRAFKQGLLDQVEQALTPPTPEPDPEPDTVEIIKKYADVPFTVSRTDTRLFRPLDTEAGPLALQEDPTFILDSDVPKRAAFKQTLLSKVTETLTPPVERQPEPFQIIDSYSPWRIVEPTETINPGLKGEPAYILDRDVPKRAAFKDDLLHKVALALTPVARGPEPAPIEIIEKYARGTQRPAAPVDSIDPGFEVNRAIIVPDGVLHSDIPRRDAFKDALLHKVDETLAPPVDDEPEAAPIEIIEKYAHGVQRSFTPRPSGSIEPGFEGARRTLVPDGLLDSDIPHRDAFKDALLHKVDETLAPPVDDEPEAAPVEIIEKYSHGVQRSFAPRPSGSIEPGFEAARRILVPDGVLDSDIPHRDAFKDALLHKVDETLAPTPVDDEPAVEIIEKYSHGVQRSFAPRPSGSIEPGFEGARRILVPDGVLDSDIPHRDAFKDALLHKVDETLAPPAPAREDIPVPVEIIERYTGPSRLDLDEMEPEFKKTEPYILDSDIPKREAIRHALLQKAATLPSPAPVEAAPVEIIGYSQRAPSPLGIEFPVIERPFPLDDCNGAPDDLHPAPVDKEKMAPATVLLVPGNYQDLDEQALYGVLIRTPSLKHSSDTANLVLDVLAGRTRQAVEFMAVEEVEPPQSGHQSIEQEPRPEIPGQFRVQDREKRVAVAARLANKINSTSAKPPIEPEPAPLNLDFDIPEGWRDVSPTVVRAELLSQGATPEQVDSALALWLETEPAPLAPRSEVTEVAVELPRDFESLRVADRYAYLTKHALLAPDDANDAIAAFDSKPQHGAKTFTFSFADIIDPAKRYERRSMLSEKAAALHVAPVTKDPVDQQFLLPADYTDLSEVELHYLMTHTPELGYSPETVYQCLDILFGRVARPTHVSFKTIPLDHPVSLGRKDQKVSVVTVETREKPKARSVF